MSDYYQTPTLQDRILAGTFDFAVPLVLWFLLNQLGAAPFDILLFCLYILFRDSFEGQSFGKRWRKLVAVNINTNKPCNWQDSVMRNLFLAIPVLGLIAMVVEFVLLVKDGDFRRPGDHFGKTMVVLNEFTPQTETE